ncbi:MAG: deoxynucleoside kinase [Bacteroidales bacterium]|nr:deoxynucleoside kinase [Lentimicrobiaceae bacterium]MDD5694201.1 deoxynucleoside kinase [Bacteroidales bacterium]
MMRYNYISIEGNIGAGKTSLAQRLSAQFNAKLILEQFEDNPFLPKFYKDPDKYAFPLELSFLASRFQQLKDRLTQQELFTSLTVSDYFIYKSLIFARRTIRDDEMMLFKRLFDLMASFLPRPDLLVYLHVDVEKLMNNIQLRGREYEQEIKESYLRGIQENYFEFFRQHTGQRILIIDTNYIDFVALKEDYDRLVEVISQEYPRTITRIVL